VIHHPFDELSLEQLRARQSSKWQVYGAETLPAWIAEMDYPTAEPIRRVLRAAVERGDLGYAFAGELGAAFASWASAHWGWVIQPSDVCLVVDVVTAIAELLRVSTAAGDAVVIDTPVYPPFASTIRSVGRSVAAVPLARGAGGWTLDLDALERAYVAGARAHVLCSPHNPTGIVYPPDTLRALGELASRHRVLLISDEVHAPLTLPGARHQPLPAVSSVAAEHSILLCSASKTWNLAGLKAALMIACADGPRQLLSRLPPGMQYQAGHLGVLGAIAAFREGELWRQQVIAILDRNRQLLAELLEQHLPEVGYVPPQAGYLAWLDFNSLGLGSDPAKVLLRRGRVALSRGPTFGVEGAGFARLNFATTRTLLEEAVQRMVAAVRAERSAH
jgi:cysteine-S-conjugate beta-lyase